jgi:hypothetical protein
MICGKFSTRCGIKPKNYYWRGNLPQESSEISSLASEIRLA